jgi:dipeptide/tripeptide permease
MDTRSTGEVVASLIVNTQAMVAKEVELLGLELRRMVARKAIAVAMLLVGALAAAGVLMLGAVTAAIALEELFDERWMAWGAVTLGFALVAWAVHAQSLPGFFASLLLVVAGFSFIQPSVHSLLSRQAPEHRQGVVLGTGQSVNAMARIFGAALAIPLFKWNLLAPYLIAAGLLIVAGLLLRQTLPHLAQNTESQTDGDPSKRSHGH